MSDQPTENSARPEDDPPDVPIYCPWCEQVMPHRPLRPSMAPDELIWQCRRAGDAHTPHSRPR